MLPATMAVGCVMAHCNAEKQSSWELTRNLYTYVMHIELKLGPNRNTFILCWARPSRSQESS